MKYTYHGVEIEISSEEKSDLLTITAKLNPPQAGIGTLQDTCGPDKRAATEIKLLDEAKRLIDNALQRKP